MRNQTYIYKFCPKNVKSRYELLVFDRNLQVFLPLSDFYDDAKKRKAKGTALTYLKCLLPFFTWLEDYSNYQGKRVHWSDPPEAIRVTIEAYLMNDLEVKVIDKDMFRFVKRTNKSDKTVKLFLAALKSFYESAIRLKHYKYNSPMVMSAETFRTYREHTEGVRKNKPRMPDIAGTEESDIHRRVTDSYFKLVNEEWKPQVIDDPYLYGEVRRAGKKVNWSLRETVIARMLFETGARASEMIELTIGDYRNHSRPNHAYTFSKGSNGVRVKFIQFTADTTKLLERYINYERIQHDSHQRKYEALHDHDPLFLTRDGKPYNYEAWYYHWRKAMGLSEMSLNPHKARHWYVTASLRHIEETYQTEAEIIAQRELLIQYMAWKNPETMKAYQHRNNERAIAEAHHRMFETIFKQEQEYEKQRKNKKKKKPELKVLEGKKEVEIPPEIQNMLDEMD
ncbi:tyrosine-type recombinase/integrase [Bacillus rhizoplanae]|uniref:tyrosine-type recombinase/integrase n=1 Tax=Bacillus rhizoplanae TaxID=2880966 RepID=UPI003D24DFEF